MNKLNLRNISKPPKYISNYYEVVSDIFTRIDTESYNSLSSLMVLTYNLAKVEQTYTPEEVTVKDSKNITMFSLTVTMHEFVYTLKGIFPTEEKEKLDSAVVYSFIVQFKELCSSLIEKLRESNHIRIKDILNYVI